MLPRGPAGTLGVTPAARGVPSASPGRSCGGLGRHQGRVSPSHCTEQSQPRSRGAVASPVCAGGTGNGVAVQTNFFCCGRAAHPPIVTLTAVLYCDSVSLSAQGGTLSLSYTHPTAQQHRHFGFKHCIFSGFPLRVGPAGVSPGFPCAGLCSRAELGGTLPSKLPYPGSCHAPVLHCGTVLQNPLLQ